MLGNLQYGRQLQVCHSMAQSWFLEISERVINPCMRAFRHLMMWLPHLHHTVK